MGGWWEPKWSRAQTSLKYNRLYDRWWISVISYVEQQPWGGSSYSAWQRLEEGPFRWRKAFDFAEQIIRIHLMH